MGKYRVNYWAAERKDENGTRWKIRGTGLGGKGVFDIAEDKEAELSIGEPIDATLRVNERQSQFSFSQDLRGRLGERIELTRNNTRPRAPKLQIRSKDGSYNRTFSFEYGCGGTCSLSWREPKNVDRPFVATVQIAGPFNISASPLWIKAKDRESAVTGEQISSVSVKANNSDPNAVVEHVENKSVSAGVGEPCWLLGLLLQ